MDTLSTHREAEGGWCSSRDHMSSGRSRERRGSTANKTPCPLSAEHPFTEQLMSAASLAAYTLGRIIIIKKTGALVDLDYSTQAAKHINRATVEKSLSRRWSISEEVCCIIFHLRSVHIGYT